MLRVSQIREAFQRCTEGQSGYAGRLEFVRRFNLSLGLGTDMTSGQPEPDFAPDGRARFLEGARLNPMEYSLARIGEAIFGIEKFRQVFDPESGGDIQSLLEAGPAIDPTTFVNINTFNLVVAGLVNARIMEQFENPALIGDELCETIPTNMNGQKFIGVTKIGDKGLTRNPGQPHTRAGFGEQWVKTPETSEKALCVEVSKEAVFFDLTGQVLDTASQVGEELAYRRELTIIDGVIGVNNTYSYKDTTYNTYQATTPWINSQSNPLAYQAADWKVIDAGLLLFSRMTDPATGKEILVNPNAVLVSPDRAKLMSHIINATAVYEGSALSSNFPGRQTVGPNPIGFAPKILSSPIYRNRITAANGLGLTSDQAAVRWYMGDFKRAFKWMENWPLRVQQASASEYVMLDRGIIAAYFANYRGEFAVREPRYAEVNTH